MDDFERQEPQPEMTASYCSQCGKPIVCNGCQESPFKGMGTALLEVLQILSEISPHPVKLRIGNLTASLQEDQ